MSKKDQYLQDFANKVIEQLKAGTAPWQKPWEPGDLQAQHNPITGTVYKGNNFAMLAMSGYQDPRWMTYNQAKKEGYQVRKGEKGTPIMFWKWEDRVPKTDDKGNKIKDAQGKQVYKSVRREYPAAMIHTVFNASQVDGIEPYEAPKGHTWEAHARAEKVLSAADEDLRGIFYDQSDRAFYRPSTDSVHLPDRSQFATEALFYSTALHEVGHATGHSSRLERDMSGGFGSEDYAREELRAEISSWMVAADLGIGHDPGQHGAYVASWIKSLEENPAEIYAACRDAEKIKTYVCALEKGVEAARETLPKQQKGTTLPAADRVAAAVPEQPRYDVYIDIDQNEQRYYPRIAQQGQPVIPLHDGRTRELIGEGVSREVMRECGQYHGIDTAEELKQRYQGATTTAKAERTDTVEKPAETVKPITVESPVSDTKEDTTTVPSSPKKEVEMTL